MQLESWVSASLLEAAKLLNPHSGVVTFFDLSKTH